MLNAYTVRKAVPRILLAVVGINLSIYFCVAAIDIITIISKGMEELLTKPFIPESGLAIDATKIEGNLASNGAFGLIVVAILKGGATIGAKAILGSIFPLMIIVALIALAVLFTLVIRQGLLIFLTVVSPVAIACFILPGTEKYFQKWFDLFIKTLMVYPIIAVIFAMSNVMAAIILGSAGVGSAASAIFQPANIINSPLFAQAATGSDSANTLKLFAALLVIYAPLVMIPFAFKLAGGAIGAVMNAAQGATANKRGSLQKNRAGKLDQAKALRRDQFDRGGFNNRGVGKAYNAFGRRRAAGMQGRFGVGKVGRAALATNTNANVAETLKNNAALNELQNNDDANNLLALSGGSKSGADKAARDLFTDENGYNAVRAERAMAAAQAVGFSRENAAAAMQTSARNKWRAVDAGRADIVQDGISRLAGSNESEARGLSYSNQYFSRESGRSDLGGNYMDLKDQDIAAHAADTGLDLATARNDLSTMDGMGRTEVHQMVRGHSSQVKQNLEVAQRLMQSSDASKREEGAIRMLEFQKSLNYASGDNQKAINEALAKTGISADATEVVSINKRDPDGKAMKDAAGNYIMVNDTRKVAIQDQLAGIINSGLPAGAAGVSGDALSSRARTYDQETARATAAGGGGPTAPTAPPAGP